MLFAECFGEGQLLVRRHDASERVTTRIADCFGVWRGASILRELTAEQTVLHDSRLVSLVF
jgi:hypothetical protein